MSLRRDVHSAFESITPPMAGMPERVVQTVLAEHSARRRKEKMLFRLRAPLSLVAALVLIALVVGALIGGRLVHDWNSQHASVPLAPPTLTLAQLEARPLMLPTLGANDPCPLDPGGSITFGFGYGGPSVYANGGSAFNTSLWTYWDIPWYTAPGLRGPVLIRGRDLRSPTIRVLFVGQNVAGPVVGSDPSPQAGAQYVEVVLEAGDPAHRITNHASPWVNYDSWIIRQGLPQNASTCIGFQIDGTGFSETFTSSK